MRVRLYAAFLRLTLQDAIQYRIESAVWFLWDVLPPLAMVFLWLTAYEDQATVAGYDLSEMLLYTVGVMVLRTLITSHIEWGMDYEIRQGYLSTYLVKPFNIWGFWFMGEFAWKVMRAVWLTPVMIVCTIWLGPIIGKMSLPPERVPLLLVSVLLGYVVCFFLKLCLGMIGFWTNDITGTTTLYEVTAAILGGIIVPLALLPEPLRILATLLPIQAIYNVPLAVLLGKDLGTNPLVGIAVQFGWIVALWLLAVALWRAGLRRYESVGG
jgi:ABC-2 type transport system permease protein